MSGRYQNVTVIITLTLVIVWLGPNIFFFIWESLWIIDREDCLSSKTGTVLLSPISYLSSSLRDRPLFPLLIRVWATWGRQPHFPGNINDLCKGITGKEGGEGRGEAKYFHCIISRDLIKCGDWWMWQFDYSLTRAKEDKLCKLNKCLSSQILTRDWAGIMLHLVMIPRNLACNVHTHHLQCWPTH